MNKIYHDIQIYSFTLNNYYYAISIVALMCQQFFRVTLSLWKVANDAFGYVWLHLEFWNFIGFYQVHKGWCIKNETHVWASGAFSIHFSEFWIKYVKIYIKFPFIWCTLLFCSLIFIRVTWENVKIHIFYFFIICQKKIARNC